jgi:hypothetical protein
MMRYGLFSLVMFTLSLAVYGQQTEQAPASKAITAIAEVRSIHLQEATTFWRHGTKTAVHDAILLRVRVANPWAFMPRDRAPPPSCMAIGSV